MRGIGIRDREREREREGVDLWDVGLGDEGQEMGEEKGEGSYLEGVIFSIRKSP